ncbi:ribonuclease P protein component [Kineosporiaceae bacterium SCSIO 59966]|nr:ribonuclease P protein component [Kineosporiaceae bacterium SCSIO 59966]
MLPAAHRMRRSKDIDRTVRRGVRAGRSRLVVHLVPDLQHGPDAPVTVAFAVSRAVGNAVTRNRVRRRLRHLMAARLGALPAGAGVVVRALPPAASASSAELGAELDSAVRVVLRRSSRHGTS